MATIASAGDLVAEITPYGPDQATLHAAKQALARQEPLRAFLAGARHRWLSFRMDEDRGGKQPSIPAHPRLFTATVYDYTNSRTLEVAGALDHLGAATVVPSSRQPIPTREEFDEAVSILRA